MPQGLTGGVTFQLLGRALDLRSDANQRIAENIANQDTPGYKARHLEFEGALQKAIGAGDPAAMAVTQPGHLGGTQPVVSVQGQETVERYSGKRDGNSVSPESEMSKLAENSLLYNASAQILGNKYRSLRNVIREGR